MTPRKELFIKTQEALKTIEAIELVDLDRKQFQKGKDNYPGNFTAVLIKSPTIDYEPMTEGKVEGNAELEVVLYCKDGWIDQHQKTADPNHGLIEIDLIDLITEKLQFLQGNSFKPLELSSEGENELSEDDLMSYTIVFKTKIYKTVNNSFPLKQKITLTQ